jgi:hypothetical protein
MESIEQAMAKALLRKEMRREALAALSFEEKVRIVVELQKIQTPILRSRGIKVKVWSLLT